MSIGGVSAKDCSRPVPTFATSTSKAFVVRIVMRLETVRAARMDLEEVWRIREEEVYPRLFGPPSRGIFPLNSEVFSRFGPQEIDPRWLTMGVFEFAPTSARQSWLYVTSGYSNPWNDDPTDYNPEGESGAGVEFTLTTTEQADWAIQTLQSMLAFDLLLDAGRFPPSQRLFLHDRVPLHGPVNGRSECLVRNLIMVEPEGFDQEFLLPSGVVILVTFIGTTDAETAFARTEGTDGLIERLRAAGHFPSIDPGRSSVC